MLSVCGVRDAFFSILISGLLSFRGNIRISSRCVVVQLLPHIGLSTWMVGHIVAFSLLLPPYLPQLLPSFFFKYFFSIFPNNYAILSPNILLLFASLYISPFIASYLSFSALSQAKLQRREGNLVPSSARIKTFSSEAKRIPEPKQTKTQAKSQVTRATIKRMHPPPPLIKRRRQKRNENSSL